MSQKENISKALEEQNNMTIIGLSYITAGFAEEALTSLNYTETFTEMYNASIQKIQEAYNSLRYEENRNYVRKNMPELLEKNINKEHQNKSMNTDTDKVLRLSMNGLEVILSGIKIKRALMDEKIRDVEDLEKGIKICGYYLSACFSKDFCNDKKTYNYLRRKCIMEYNELEYEQSKSAVLKYVNKEFLKIR